MERHRNACGVSLLFTFLLGCGAPSAPPPPAPVISTGGSASVAVEEPAAVVAAPARVEVRPPSEHDRLVQAEAQAAGGARRVLSTARTMIDDDVQIRGTCATWLNAVYRRAGGNYTTVFSGDRRGRYANVSLLQPGDWIHFINHSFGNVTHSAIFVGWTNRESSIALTMSHPGQQRESAGRFRDYELTSVYRIDRMRD